MKLDKIVLAETMAFLISVPPESKLAKLLTFCLATKVRDETGRGNILKITYELMQNPSNLPYWTQEIMGSNFDYTSKEWEALGEMNIKNTEEFMNSLWQELENLNL